MYYVFITTLFINKVFSADRSEIRFFDTLEG